MLLGTELPISHWSNLAGAVPLAHISAEYGGNIGQWDIHHEFTYIELFVTQCPPTNFISVGLIIKIFFLLKLK